MTKSFFTVVIVALFLNSQFVWARSATANTELQVAVRAMAKIPTVGDALTFLENFYPADAVQVIRASFVKNKIPLTTRLPTLSIDSGDIKTDGKVSVKILSQSPLKISHNGQVWTWNSNRSLDTNFAELSRLFSKKHSVSQWSKLLLGTAHAEIDSLNIATDLASLGMGMTATFAILVLAGVTWPLWAMLGTMVAGGLTLTAALEYVHGTKTLYKCSADGDGYTLGEYISVSMFLDSKLYVRTKAGRYATAQRITPQPAEAAAMKEIIRLCKESPEKIEQLNKEIKAGLLKLVDAPGTVKPTSR